MFSSTDHEREFTSEFVINNLTADQREHLLLKDVRTRISDSADVSIAVRGRYIKPRSNGRLICDGNEKPLYLLISGKSKQHLTRAMEEIQRILTSAGSRNNNGLCEDDSLEDKITVGIEMWPAQFSMKSKILGDNNEFVEYIEKETGAVISLRGKGSNFADDNKYDEPLHVYVKYENSQMKEKTRELVLNLIETVQRDFLERYAKYYAHPKKPEIIPVRIQGVHKSSNENSTTRKKTTEVKDFQPKNDTDKITVGFDYAPRNFDLKAKLYGPNNAHTQHIEKEGGALILLRGRGCRFPEKDDVDEPPHLLVKYKNPELKSKARELIFNLLETVHRDYIRSHGTLHVSPKKPQIVPYDPRALLTEKKSPERSGSATRSEDHLRLPNTPSLSKRRQNSPPLSGRCSNTSPSRRPITPPPSSRRLRSPLSPRRLDSPPSLSRRPSTPPSLSRRPITPPVSRRPSTPPSSSRRPITPPSKSRRSITPPSKSRRSITPPSRRLNSPPLSSRRLNSPPLSSRRPNTPPSVSPTMISSRHLISPPKSLRHLNTPPRSSRRTPKRSMSHHHRSRSPVNAPPPPVISKPYSPNIYNSSDPLPPIIPPLKDSKQSKPIPVLFGAEDYVKPKEHDGTLQSYHPWKTSQVELKEPMQEFKNPEFYMTQPKQLVHFVLPSFTSQSTFSQQQVESDGPYTKLHFLEYIKKRSNSPESSINHSFPENKKYCPPFFDIQNANTELKQNAKPVSTASSKNMDNKGRDWSIIDVSTRTEFAAPKRTPTLRNIPTNNKPVPQFNGYDFKMQNTHTFATPSNSNITSRRPRNKQTEKSYSMNNNSSDSEDAASVICLDSEDDFYHPEHPTSTNIQSRKPTMYSVKVQTMNEDEVLRNKKLQCICGHFRHFLTGVRSCAVQTDPERYCRF